MLYSLVLPAFNPGPAIVETIGAIRGFLREQSEAWEIVLVLDGCTDGTEARLNSLHLDSRFRVLAYPRNQGKGHAVAMGLREARGDIRIFTDIDLAYGFDDILRVARTIRNGALVAIASRSHPESEIRLPLNLLGYAWRRNLQSAIFGMVVRCLLPIRQRDTQAGLKGFSADVVRHIVPHICSRGFGFDCELLTACHLSGIAVDEVPVLVHCPDRASTTNRRTALAMLREIWKIRRHWRRRTVPVFVADTQIPVGMLKAA